MSNLADMERRRLRLYGEMLKSDLTERRNQEKMQKQAILKRDSIDLERHIQNTRKMDLSKRLQIKEMNNALKEDNMMLSTLKKGMSFGKTYAEQGQNFINEIHQMDGKRLNRLKNDLAQQFHDNRDFTSNKRMIEQKIQEIEKLQAERHTNRVKEMQIESVKSYENIKKKHQQDMQLFEKHKKLVEVNQDYRDQIESFTQVRGGGILDRFNRNQYLQRRASLRQNQDEIMKQMEQFERRKQQDNVEYKKKVGNLQESMLASILSKPPRYEPKAYSSELRHQMHEDSMRRFEESSVKKQKIELNNIYGGVHGNQREKMIRIIDRGLGIDRLSHQSLATNSKKPDLHIQSHINTQNNPQQRLSESQRFPTPKNNERFNNSQQIYTNAAPDHQQPPKIDFSSSQVSNASSQNRRYFKSYDLITGKNRYYGAQ